MLRRCLLLKDRDLNTTDNLILKVAESEGCCFLYKLAGDASKDAALPTSDPLSADLAPPLPEHITISVEESLGKEEEKPLCATLKDHVETRVNLDLESHILSETLSEGNISRGSEGKKGLFKKKSSRTSKLFRSLSLRRGSGSSPSVKKNSKTFEHENPFT